MNEPASLLRAVLDATAEGILVLDSEGHVVLSNFQFRVMWGATGDDEPCDGDALLEFMAEQLDDPVGFLAPMKAGDFKAPVSDSLVFLDGRIYERSGRPHVVDGTVVGRVWCFRNVSRRRRAEREAAESQVRFDLVSRATNDAVYDWDLRGDTAWLNGNFSAMFGAPGAGSAGQWWLGRIHPDDRTRVERSVYEAFAGEVSTWIEEYRFQRPDGSFAYVFDRGYIVRDAAGQPLRLIGAIMDLTARKEFEERLERLAAILESTTDYVGTADVSGRLQYVNQAARRLVGLAPDADVSGLTLEDFHAGWASNDQVREGMLAAVAQGSWSGETVIRGADGRDVPVSHVILAHKGPHGDVAYLSTIARDMSGVRSLQRQLLQSQKMEAVGQLAGGIAHDFNNLLTVIKAHCEFLGDDIRPGHALRADVDAISAAGDRASSLTSQLLAFSRQQFMKPVALDINSVVQGLEPMLRRLIGEDIAFTTVCRDDIGVVKADPRQMEQVLLNLAVNARDAMPRGGALTISTRRTTIQPSNALVTAGSLAAGDYVVLSVHDTGSGMTPMVRERIFEPFFTTKEQGKGTGLGLSTVYGIVKQSGGHVTVSSEPSHGSTFILYLPRHEGKAEPPAVAAQAQLPRGTEHVLLVEDEEALRLVAERILKRQGYQVTTARDGREAAALAARPGMPIDILVTDVVMPHMGGRELADHLRRDRPGIAVLFMSGYTEDDVLRRGVSSAEAVLLQKPFSPQALAAQVRAVLDQPRYAAGAEHRFVMPDAFPVLKLDA